MAPLKRPAAAQKAQAHKKIATELKQKAAPAGLMQNVRSAISESTLAPFVKDRLRILIDDSLGVSKDLRKKFQEDIVHLIGAILQEEEQKMAQAVHKANSAHDKAIDERAIGIEAVKAAKAQATMKQETLVMTQARLAEAKTQAESKAREHEVAKNELQASTVEVAQAHAKLKAALADVVKCVHGCEDVARHLETSWTDLCTARESKLQAAKLELDDAAQGRGACELEAATAVKEMEQAAADVQAAAKSCRRFEAEMDSAQSTKEASKAKLQQFRDGALSAYKKLAG